MDTYKKLFIFYGIVEFYYYYNFHRNDKSTKMNIYFTLQKDRIRWLVDFCYYSIKFPSFMESVL